VTWECTTPVAPTETTTVSTDWDRNFDVQVFSAGTNVFAMKPLGNGTAWLRWTGTGWSEEPVPWPSGLSQPRTIDRIVKVANGNALIVTQGYLTTFDGTSMSSPVPLPVVNTPWAYAQSPTTGAYHVFGGDQEAISKPDGTWYPAAPIPFAVLQNAHPDATATVTADGRTVVVYHDVWFFDDDPSHVHVLTHESGKAWTTDVDVTPTWSVHASHLYVYAPPGGGVVIGANGSSGVVWRSADATTFGDYESLGIFDISDIAGPCLDALVVTAGYQTRYDLLTVQGTTWSQLASESHDYIDDAHAAMLPDGRTFWVLGETYRIEYRAAP
jgi:hypothetical protein